MNRFVRPSKFRHVYGSAAKRDQCYDNLQVSYDSNDMHLAKCNGKYLSVHWAASGGGAFAVLPVEAVGRQPADLPLFEGHSAQVLDTEFSPFNDNLLASAGEDARILLWNIPQPGEASAEGGVKPEATLAGHDRKIVDLLFHPAAENVLASASHDQTVRLWDIERAACKITLTDHSDAVLDQSWSYDGSRIATSCRDKMLRIFDPRANASKASAEVKAHEGVKGVRVVWAGPGERLITTGFSRMSDRQFALWDARNLEKPVKLENLDTSSGLLIPHYDADTRMLYLAGKGDGNIRFYELVDEAPFAHFLSEYKSTEPQRAVTFLPKRAVHVSENEVARAYKVHNNLVEPISFRVPRKVEAFQADLFPDTPGPEPALSASEYFDENKTAAPKLISLEGGYAPSLRRQFTVSLDKLSQSTTRSASGLIHDEPAPVDDVKKLREEIEQLKAELAKRDELIAELRK